MQTIFGPIELRFCKRLIRQGISKWWFFWTIEGRAKMHRGLTNSGELLAVNHTFGRGGELSVG